MAATRFVVKELQALEPLDMRRRTRTVYRAQSLTDAIGMAAVLRQFLDDAGAFWIESRDQSASFYARWMEA
jgi:hypothetical protein